MTRDELIAAVPIRESRGRLYVRIDDVPAPWREQFAAAMEGSAFIAVQGETCITPFAHDWDAWVRDQWHGRPGPTGLDNVGQHDLQSLLMHQEVVRMVRADPSLEARALEILERWDTTASIRSKPLRDEWKRIIAERDWELAVEESDRGQQLRQASPMAILLPEQVRLDIIKSARAMHESKGPRSPWKTRYFVDTEFTDFIDCRLISIAIVGEDGSEFYGECSDVDLSVCSEFVRAAVLPQLGQFPGRSMPATRLRDELRAWLLAMPTKPKRILCFDYQGDYDLVLDLLDGEMPVGWKCEHVGGKLDVERLERYFREHGGRHHALHDARANAFAFL